MAQTIRLLLAHGTESCRARLRALLSAGDGLELVGEAASAEDALRLCQELAPQVLLLDARLPEPAWGRPQ